MRRRDFLGAMLLTACAPLRPTRSRIRTTPATHFEIQSKYPPIPPLADAVYEKRRARARELTRAAGGDFLVATAGATNFAYLAGSDFYRSERLIALVLPVDGEPLLLAPSFEVERVRRGVRGLAVSGWEESENPLAKIRDFTKKGKLLIEPRTDYTVAAHLGRDNPIADAAGVFEELRVKKSDEELERIRRAVRITEDAFAGTFERLEVGMTEREVSRIADEEHARRGVEGYALVQFGPSAALPHGGPTSAPLAANTLVLIDGGCRFQGWWSDVTRTRWFGPSPSARFLTLHNLVHDAQSAAIARVAPGVPAQEIDRAARAVIAAGGFARQFTHRLGHGMGMDGHEPVYLVEGNSRPLQPGLVFSVEPGIYLPGELGVRLEEVATCTPSGAEVLSIRPPRL
jgi:Xaa-Pro dipeptidase